MSMDKVLITLFGEGRELNILQMSCRGMVIFVIALILIRISGRRSFGIRTALDNIIVILLGAVMSRAVVGASPFLPVVFCCLLIVLLHRGTAWLLVRDKKIGRFIEGDKILLYDKGVFIEENLARALVCRKDVMQGIRKSALTERLEEIEKIYMERNGEISAVKSKTE